MNILLEMYKQIPKAMKSDKSELQFVVGKNTVNDLKHFNGFFLGIPILVVDGAPEGNIYLSDYGR